jgi:hypothetical protein
MSPDRTMCRFILTVPVSASRAGSRRRLASKKGSTIVPPTVASKARRSISIRATFSPQARILAPAFVTSIMVSKFKDRSRTATFSTALVRLVHRRHLSNFAARWIGLLLQLAETFAGFQTLRAHIASGSLEPFGGVGARVVRNNLRITGVFLPKACHVLLYCSQVAQLFTPTVARR